MEREGEGKNHFDEDLTGQVENRVQEQKDLPNASAADALKNKERGPNEE